MKNLTFYKSVMALLTMGTMTLFSGCSSNTSNTNTNTNNNNNESTQQAEQKDDSCTHLTVYFENEPVTFKECEGYELSTLVSGRLGGVLEYDIYINEMQMFSGYTQVYNIYEVNHSVADELIESKPVEKVK